MSFLPLLTVVGPRLPPPPLLPDFGVSVCFATDQTVMAVRGELDLLTAPALGTFLDIAAQRRGCPVVIDFAALTFINASRLKQVARGPGGPAPSGHGPHRHVALPHGL